MIISESHSILLKAGLKYRIKSFLCKDLLHITSAALIITLIASVPVFSKVVLPKVLSDGLVLQQQSSCKLWGTSRKSAKVTIKPSWNQESYSTTADANGRWELTLKTPTAGGPYRITFDDGEITALENILLGEVWICSGQSNMAMRLQGGINQPVYGYHNALLQSRNEQLRVFTVDVASANAPASDVKGEWKVSGPESAPGFSAVAFWYGKMLQEYLKVPVGLIVTSVGGTPIRSWMDAESLKALPEAQTDLNGKQPNVLYNAMIAPLVNYKAKGFLWYQGEADRAEPLLYGKQLKAMVSQWRQAWGSPEMPFYYVQIAPWLYPPDSPTAAPELREEQLRVSREIPNSGIAITMDVGSDQSIHPPEKKIVGERLAYIALAKTYGVRNIPYAGPEYKNMTVSGNKAILTFDHAEQGLYFTNKESSNFEIAGADRVFYPAKAVIRAKGIEVESSKVAVPVAVRYGFRNYVKGDLYNTYGLPASSFRTDNWQSK